MPGEVVIAVPLRCRTGGNSVEFGEYSFRMLRVQKLIKCPHHENNRDAQSQEKEAEGKVFFEYRVCSHLEGSLIV